MMQSTRLAIGLVTALLATLPAHGDRVRNVKIGESVPPFTVRTLAGDELDSADLAGKVVVLVYVAAEQQSSEKATAIAAAIGQELRDETLAIVAMTADATRVGFFRQQRSRLDASYRLGLDVGRRVYGDLGIIVLPTTIVIDREGRLAHVLSSYKSDYEHVLRAYIRHTLGLVDDAGLERLLTVQQVPRDDEAERVARHRAAAKLLRQKRLLANAESELRAALEIDPGHADTRLDLASLCVAAKRIDEAETLVDDVRATAPDGGRVKLLHGMVLYHRDRLDDAEFRLREALLLNPDPALTYYYLGLVAERRGDQGKAIEHFKASLSRLLADRGP